MSSNLLRPLDRDAFGRREARHLLNRAGFGGSPQRVREIYALGLHDAVDSLVDFHTIDWPNAHVKADTFDPEIMRPMRMNERLALRRARQAGDEAALEQARMQRQQRQREDRRQMREIQKWWLQRMIDTPRPLEEKLTLFWHSHFATNYRAIEDSYHMFLQNQMFRKYGCGTFDQLAFNIIRDPAMLRYLNNNTNRKRAPNENLARELMELFVLGEGNGYTERDIKQGARALTGYTYRDDDFVFRKRWHDDGVKNILGQVGRWDGDDFVRIILNRRAASEFICYKLYQFFVKDVPGEPDATTQQFVVDLAERFRESEYDIRETLRTMFLSQHFYDETNMAAKIKSPVQLVVEAIRTLNLSAANTDLLLRALDRMGQNLFFPPSVNGWDGGRAWINTSTLFIRQNTLVYLLTGGRRGALADLTPLVDHVRDANGRLDTEATVRELLAINLAGPPHEKRVRTLVDFVNQHGGRMDNRMLAGLMTLIAALPEYQVC